MECIGKLELAIRFKGQVEVNYGRNQVPKEIINVVFEPEVLKSEVSRPSGLVTTWTPRVGEIPLLGSRHRGLNNCQYQSEVSLRYMNLWP